MPTFSCKDPIFDPKASHTSLGIIPDTFWQRKGVLRSYHPTHSVSAFGKDAEYIIKDHENASTAYAEGTPYHKLALLGGFILLLGVDQDRSTTLHTAEALANAPYLKTIYSKYKKDGKEIEIKIEKMAGPHRNFIGLDKIFKEKGLISIGKIGNAVCRLIDAKAMIDIVVELIKGKPDVCLCDNPSCKDCLMQKGQIKEAMLKNEDFKLSIDISNIKLEPSTLIKELKYQGINYIQIDTSKGEDLSFKEEILKENILVSAVSLNEKDDIDKGIKIARFFESKFIIVKYTDINLIRETIHKIRSTGIALMLENYGEGAVFYDELLKNINSPVLSFAFSPAEFTVKKEKPFSKVFYLKRNIKNSLNQLYIEDVTYEGEQRLLGNGNAEIKELISILRCASFSGFFTLRSGQPLNEIRSICYSFWRIMEEI
jgi:aminoglycoside 3-N-acetyltransferase